MDTLRVDIAYRPLRIGWIIKAGDFEAFREVVRFSHALWGGCFNPILIADREEEARRLIEVYRVDFLHPVGDSVEVRDFSKNYPHLRRPNYHDDLFLNPSGQEARSNLLDVQNALFHIRSQPARQHLIKQPAAWYRWAPADPLADIFLINLGAYPDPARIGIHYEGLFGSYLTPALKELPFLAPVPAESLTQLTVASLSRVGLNRHHKITSRWDYPGFFAGRASDLDDLICYWNLRAADIALQFLDLDHMARFGAVIHVWEKQVQEEAVYRREIPAGISVWARREILDSLPESLTKGRVQCPVSTELWNGLNLLPPMMHLDKVSALSVVGKEGKRIKISFPLTDKPFSGDAWFHTQHLVASISWMGGLYGDDHHTLVPPYLPELNDFYGRVMHYLPGTIKVESGGIGIVIDAADSDAWHFALPTADLFEQVFRLGGYQSKLSNGGLIARQVVARLGTLHGARVFIIPGVRRLIKSHGPLSSFTREKALQLIGGADPDRPGVKFSDYNHLFFEPREPGQNLTPPMVFSYLVQQGLFRIGHDLICPNCRLPSWTSVDGLRQKMDCELCGTQFDATGQLVEGRYSYRRSGILGAERNAMGAVPVALTLHQIDQSLDMLGGEAVYSLSLNLTPIGAAANECEIDFAWLIAKPFPEKPILILGECKDVGPIDPQEFQRDVETLLRVAEALPTKRFEIYFVMAKLSAFTPQEIECARTLNTKYEYRVILLTEAELEADSIYEAMKDRGKVSLFNGVPSTLARATAKIYFEQ